MTDSSSLTYVANAGILLKIRDKKILIDGLCTCEIPIYKTTPEIISQQIIQGLPPFENIDLLLITHDHNDHFAAKKTSEFLKQNQNATVISTNEVVAQIKAELLNSRDHNLIALNPALHCAEELTVKGITIEVISMRHEGKEFASVNNLAFLIKDEVNVLHVGDAAAIPENYQTLKLQEKRIDLIIAPFPYIGLPSARQIIKEYISPHKIVLVHLPYQELDSYGWITATKKSYNRIKDDFIATEFMEEVGTTIII